MDPFLSDRRARWHPVDTLCFPYVATSPPPASLHHHEVPTAVVRDAFSVIVFSPSRAPLQVLTRAVPAWWLWEWAGANTGADSWSRGRE